MSIAMNKTLFGLVTWLFFAISVDAIAKVDINKDQGEDIYSVSIEDIIFKKAIVDQREFVVPTLKGIDGYEGVLFKEGNPEIPVVRFYIETQLGDDVRIDIAKGYSTHRLDEGLEIKPVQPSRPKIKGATVDFVINEKLYGSHEFYPKQDYSIESAGSIRGVEQKLVTIYPFSYNPKDKLFRIIKNFSVHVKKVNKKAATDYLIKNEIFAFVIGKKFASSPSLKAYEDLKRKLGYDVREIVIGTDANTPDDIRKKLKVLYSEANSTLKYTLIIGDAEDVPGQKAGNISGITDHYYRAIDTADYASDLNGPDQGVGRISVKTEESLAAVLLKYTKYAEGKFSTDAWLNGASFLATDDLFEIAEGSHNYVISQYTAPSLYRGIFPEAHMLGGDQLYAITHAVPNDIVQQALRSGRTIVSYSGHGATDEWDAPKVVQSDVRNLQHEDAVPFTTSFACFTGDFRVDESFAETWQRHPQGAVMFWGSMDSSYWEEDDVLERRLFDGIYKNSLFEFGDVTNHALKEHWKHYGGAGRSKYYWETYVSFGDPSLRFRSKAVQKLTIEGPDFVPRDLRRVDYIVYDGVGAPMSGVRLALTSPDRSQRLLGMTDDTGRVTFNLVDIRTSELKNLELFAYGNDSKLESRTLNLTDGNAVYYAFSNLNVNRENSRSLKIGEVSDVGFSIENMGRDSAGGEVRLEKISGPVEIIDSKTITIPRLAAGQSYQVSDNFLKIKAKKDANSGEIVTLLLKWQSKEGFESLTSGVLRVVRGKILLYNLDAGQNQINGGIRPGKTGNVNLILKNIGTETIERAVITGNPGDCVSAVQGEVAFERLDPGAVVQGKTPLQVTVSKDCKNDQNASLDVSGRYESDVEQITLAKTSNSFRIGVWEMTSVSSGEVDMSIPDEDEDGLIYNMNIARKGVIDNIGIRVKVQHASYWDLQIVLVNPSGDQTVLFNGEMITSPVFDFTYGMGGKPQIDLTRNWKGKPLQGKWKLIIKDTMGGNTGNLKNVELNVRGYLNE